MRRSLHKLVVWFRYFYPRSGRRETYSRESDTRGKKLESRNSSDTESEALHHRHCHIHRHHHHHHHSIVSRPIDPTLTRSQMASKLEPEPPTSEEYKKMISGVPFHVVDDVQLQARKLQARQFCAKYNVDDEVLKNDEMPLHELFMALRAERESLLRTIIGRIGEGPVIEPPFNFQYGFNITMGDSVYANVNLRIMDSGEVVIGDRVLIGPNVTIVTELHDKELGSRREVHAHPVTIEEDCWIGVGTTILPGVTIGKGSVSAPGPLSLGVYPHSALHGEIQPG